MDYWRAREFRSNMTFVIVERLKDVFMGLVMPLIFAAASLSAAIYGLPALERQARESRLQSTATQSASGLLAFESALENTDRPRKPALRAPGRGEKKPEGNEKPERWPANSSGARAILETSKYEDFRRRIWAHKREKQDHARDENAARNRIGVPRKYCRV
ncbi:Uncharacterised protein [Candidatus Burarchaeum australiense]|nr:Uncharacterised protein [Candidatus Burarchaeum australiense]